MALFTPWEWGANTKTHTHTHLSLHAAHLFLALLPLFTHLVSEVNALFVGSECVITVTRERNRFMKLSQEPQSLYFRPGPVLQKSQFNPLFTLHVLNIYGCSFRSTAPPADMSCCLCDSATSSFHAFFSDRHCGPAAKFTGFSMTVVLCQRLCMTQKVSFPPRCWRVLHCREKKR